MLLIDLFLLASSSPLLSYILAFHHHLLLSFFFFPDNPRITPTICADFLPPSSVYITRHSSSLVHFARLTPRCQHSPLAYTSGTCRYPHLIILTSLPALPECLHARPLGHPSPFGHRVCRVAHGSTTLINFQVFHFPDFPGERWRLEWIFGLREACGGL